MNRENIRYITDQITSYINEIKTEKIKPPSTDTSIAIGFDTCDYDSNYPKPENLVCIFVSQAISIIEARFLFFKFSLVLEEKKHEKIIPLTVRWKPLDNALRTNIRGRKQLPRHAFYTDKGVIDTKNRRIYPSDNPEDVEEGFQNLIIIEPKLEFKDKDHDIIGLQIGIYLFREGVLNDRWVLYALFQRIVNRLDKEDILIGFDENIFDRLIERFTVPNNTRSIVAYINYMLRELVRKSGARKIGRTEIVKSYSDKEDERDYYDIEISNEFIFDVPIQTLYTLIHRGKLQVPMEDGKYLWNKARNEIEDYGQDRTNKKLIKLLAKKYSEKNKISLESGERAIRRWRAKGLSIQQMAKRI